MQKKKILEFPNNYSQNKFEQRNMEIKKYYQNMFILS